MKFNFPGRSKIEDVIKILSHGLTKLSFEDNMESFKYHGTIKSGGTVTIRNKLTSIPTKYIIVSQEGNGLVTKTDLKDGEETIKWNTENVFLKNNGSEAVKITVIFMR